MGMRVQLCFTLSGCSVAIDVEKRSNLPSRDLENWCIAEPACLLQLANISKDRQLLHNESERCIDYPHPLRAGSYKA